MKKLYTLFLMSLFALGLSYAQEPLFFSEYIEGGSNNKALEIYNPTGASVDLAAYEIFSIGNGGDDWETFNAFADGASIGAGEVYVVAHGSAVAAILDQADETATTPVYFNGDDARALVYITATDTTVLDIIGVIGPDPGTAWDVAGITNATQNYTLVRKPTITAGTDDWSSSAGTDLANSQWMVWEQDDFSDIGKAPVLLTALSLAGDGGATTIEVDDATLQIVSTATPTNATIAQKLTWSVNDDALGSIDENGLLTAIDNGTVTVTASANDGSGIDATMDVIISNQVDIIAVSSITVTGTGGATTIGVSGGTLQMLAEVLPAEADDLTYTWSVDNDLLASISTDGLLSAKRNGTVAVTATANDASGVSGSLNIEISGQDDTMKPLFFSEYIEGGSNRKGLEIYNPNAEAVSLAFYEIAQSNNGSGWIYYHQFPAGASIAAGDVWVIVTNDDLTGYFDVANADEVLAYPSVAHHNGDDARAIIYISITDTTFIDIIGIPDEDPGTAWEVAGVSNATANHTLVRKSNVQNGNTDWAASAGTNTEDSEWMVYDQDEFSYLGAHTYYPLITSITLAGAGGATTVDTDKGTLQIEATVLPVESAGQDLDWTVSDENMASVSETGLLSAINDGTVTVTATAKDGSSASGTVDIMISNQISIVPVTSITVTGTGDATTITDNGGTLQMLAAVVPADATDATYTWSVDDPDIATIDAAGLLSAVTNGTVSVIATANDGYGGTGSLAVTISDQYTEVADLTALKALDPSNETMVYKIVGEVLLTYKQTFRSKKYVQDVAGGVEIDDSPGNITTAYNVGDGITGLMGTIEEYRGMLQFHPVSDPGAASTTGNALVPVVITPTQLNENIDMYESRLVTLESVTFNDADGSVVFANGTDYELKDAVDTVICRTNFYDIDLIGTVVPDSAHVTGICIQFYENSQISPRSVADVVELAEYVESDDASISDLLVDATSVAGFTPAQLSYNVVLHHSTTTVPPVTVVTSNDQAVVNVTPATNLDGTEAERTTTVLITSEDESNTKTYTVVFSLNVGIDDQNGESFGIYPVPAGSTLHVRSMEALSELRVISITGSTLKVVELSGEKNSQLDISELESGVYFLKLTGETSTRILRFVKN